MAWGSDLLNGILGTLFGEEEGSDSKKDDAKFGYSRPCGHTNSSKFRYDPLEDDVPEAHYERESERNKSSQQDKDRESSAKPSQNNYSQQNSYQSKTSQQNRYSQQNRRTQQSSYSQQNNYSQQKKSYYNYDDTTDDSDYYSNNTYYDADDDSGETYYGNPSDFSDQSQSSWDNYGSQNLKKDKSAKASQGFRRQHATKSRPGEQTYPTLSSKNSKFVKNDRASFTFGDPHFSTYDHGVRGIAFPYSLKIRNPRNRRIVVSGKFCTNTGAWIKSLVPEMADMYGDLVINESVYCVDDTFCVDSYLFVPYGVLSLKFTQKIYLNVDVFVDGLGPQHLIRYVYGFEYYIYENDPRESVYQSTSTSSTSTFSNNQIGLEELIGLVAHVIKADGVCAPQEVRAVIDFFKKFKDVDKDFLKERLKYKLSNPSNMENDCKVLREAFNTQTRLVFLGLFFKIAVADESVPKIELDIIEKISDLMGIPKSSFSDMSLDFLPASDKIWHIFGLTSKATKEQLKSAYRVKCKECHPDRFANASKEEYKRAEERFKELQDMYNFLLRKYSNL